MIVALACHTALGLISLFKLAIAFEILELIIGALLTLVGFMFTCWALPIIGDARGERIVLGKTVVGLFTGLVSGRY